MVSIANTDDNMSFNEKTDSHIIETVIPSNTAPVSNLKALWLANGILNDVPATEKAKPTNTILVRCYLRPRPPLIRAKFLNLPIYNRNLKGFTTKYPIKPYNPREPAKDWDEENYRCSVATSRTLQEESFYMSSLVKPWELGVKYTNIVGLYRNGVAYSIDQHGRIFDILTEEGHRRHACYLPPAEFIILFEPPAHWFQKRGYKKYGRVYLSAADCALLKRNGVIEAPTLIDGMDGGKTVINTVEGLGLAKHC